MRRKYALVDHSEEKKRQQLGPVLKRETIDSDDAGAQYGLAS